MEAGRVLPHVGVMQGVRVVWLLRSGGRVAGSVFCVPVVDDRYGQVAADGGQAAGELANPSLACVPVSRKRDELAREGGWQ